MISIVTPTLNCKEFLAESLSSVSAQKTRAPVEHIIVDGRSTDGSLDIIRSYCQEYPTARLINLPGSSQSDAINAGMAAAKGQIAGWLNGDDLLEPGALETIRNAFADSPDIVMAYGETTVTDERGKALYSPALVPFDVARLLNRGNFIPQPSTFFLREAFLDVGGLDASLDFCMDYDLWLKLGERGNVGACRSKLSRFRLHGTSKTCSRQWRFHVEHVRVCLRHGGGIWSPTVRSAIKYLLKEPLRKLAVAAGRRDPRACLVPKGTPLN